MMREGTSSINKSTTEPQVADYIWTIIVVPITPCPPPVPTRSSNPPFLVSTRSKIKNQGQLRSHKDTKAYEARCSRRNLPLGAQCPGPHPVRLAPLDAHNPTTNAPTPKRTHTIHCTYHVILSMSKQARTL